MRKVLTLLFAAFLYFILIIFVLALVPHDVIGALMFFGLLMLISYIFTNSFIYIIGQLILFYLATILLFSYITTETGTTFWQNIEILLTSDTLSGVTFFIITTATVTGGFLKLHVLRRKAIIM